MSEFIRTIEIKELRKEVKKHGLMMDRCPTKMSIATMLPEANPKKLAQNGGTLPGYSSGTHLIILGSVACPEPYPLVTVRFAWGFYGLACTGLFLPEAAGCVALFPVVPTHNSGSCTGNARKIVVKHFLRCPLRSPVSGSLLGVAARGYLGGPADGPPSGRKGQGVWEG